MEFNSISTSFSTVWKQEDQKFEALSKKKKKKSEQTVTAISPLNLLINSTVVHSAKLDSETRGVAQLIECLPSMLQVLGMIPRATQSSMVMHYSHPSTQVVEV